MENEVPDATDNMYQSTTEQIQQLVQRYSHGDAWIRKNNNQIAIKWALVSGTSAKSICDLFKKEHGTDKFEYAIKDVY